VRLSLAFRMVTPTVNIGCFLHRFTCRAAVLIRSDARTNWVRALAALGRHEVSPFSRDRNQVANFLRSALTLGRGPSVPNMGHIPTECRRERDQVILLVEQDFTNVLCHRVFG